MPSVFTKSFTYRYTIAQKGIRAMNPSGSSDYISFSAGATNGMAAGGGVTVAMICKRLGTNGTSIVQCANSPTGGTFTCNLALSVKSNGNGNFIYFTVVNTGGLIVDSVSTTTFTSTDGWCLIAATKAAGTSVAPRIHKIPLGGSPIHVDSPTNQTNGKTLTSASQWEMGRDEFLNHVNQEVAVGGVWNVAMTDNQIEGLVTNLKTSDFWNSTAGHPLALWQFYDEAPSTGVTDLSGGGANQAAISGTSVNWTDLPPGWNFNGVGP